MLNSKIMLNSERMENIMQECYLDIEFFKKINEQCMCEYCDLMHALNNDFEEIFEIEEELDEIVTVKMIDDNDQEYNCFFNCVNCVNTSTNLYGNYCSYHREYEISKKDFERIGVIDFICHKAKKGVL